MWVETDAPCEVEVCGCSRPHVRDRGPSLRARPRHRASSPSRRARTRSRLDGERVWPLDDGWPASCIRTIGDDHDLRITFGSCRVAHPDEPPWTLTKDEDPRGREHDALRALAMKMRAQDVEDWPHLLLLLGDQVYADEVPVATAEFIAARRDPSRPAGRGGRRLRGVLPPLPRLVDGARRPLAAVDRADGDDLRRPRRPRRLEHVERLGRATSARQGWWDERIVGGFMAYWVYQHLGNLSPEDRMDDATLLRRARGRGRRRADRPRVRLRRRPRGRGRALELPPRPRPHADRDDGLARRPRAAPGAPPHGRRRGVGLHRAVDARAVRPPAPRHLAARVPRPRHALPRGLERGGLRRGVGPHRGAAWASASAAPSTSSTGPRSATRCATSRTSSSGSRAAATASGARERRPPLGRRPPRLSRARRFARATATAAPSTRRSARRCATRSTATSAAAIRIGMSRGRPSVSAGALARAAGVAEESLAGRSRRGRGSTTRSRRSSSTAADGWMVLDKTVNPPDGPPRLERVMRRQLP